MAALAAAAVLLPAMRASTHGGPPLRLGVTADPAVSALGRLFLVHLREGVGFAVEWKEFADDPALRAAFVGRQIDIAIGVLPGDPAAQRGACSREKIAGALENLQRSWGGEVFPMRFALDPSTCAWPWLAVSRTVLDDLRFGILGKEAARMAGLVSREDVDAVRAAAARGGERAATAAARGILGTRTAK